MTSSASSPSSPQPESAPLDDSGIRNPEPLDQSHDDSMVSLAMDTTPVNFDETLAVGVAPQGFVVLDETLNSTRLDVQEPNDPVEPPPKPADESIEASQPAEEPAIKVVFKDTVILKRYCKKIERFLKDLLTQGCDRDIISCTTDLVLNIFSSKHLSDVSHEETQNVEQPNCHLFTVDTVPKLKDDLDIPMYGKKFNKALEKSKGEIVEEKAAPPRFTCFNCLGNHNLRDCDQPRNPGAINKNRKEYAAKRGPTNSRYHLEDDQRFGHYVPGQISSNLRQALGLHDDELPRHVYRMRVLGYPPGWLEEARQQHSGITLFNSEGIAETGSDEEGEIVSPGDKDKYDVKKIIDFPGFNILPPAGIREECQQYWGSPTQEQYSKSTMLSYMSSKKAEDGYKRRKLVNPALARNKTNANPGEMDIDETEDTPVESLPVKGLFIPPLPRETDGNPPPPPPPPETEGSENQAQENNSNSNDGSTGSSSSPTLGDLESEKEKLKMLLELVETTSQTNSDTGTNDIHKQDSSVNENANASLTEGIESNSTKTEDLNNSDVNNVTPKNNSRSISLTGASMLVKEVHEGTPILKSCSPYKTLPSSEKFSKDICDVINFENLPDSTGKYDQMTEILQKVRKTMTELQKE